MDLPYSSNPPAPPGQNLAVTITVVAITALSVLCMFLQVIPGDGRGGASDYLLALGLAAIYAVIQFLIVGRVRRWAPLAFPYAWAMLLVVATALYSLFLWPVVRAGLPWTAAAIAGEPFTERFEMHTNASLGRRNNLGCKYQLRGGPLELPQAPDYRLCITAEQWRQFPDTPVAVTVTGDRTAWGMRVKEIVAIEASAAP